MRVASNLIKFIRHMGCVITGHDPRRHPGSVRGVLGSALVTVIQFSKGGAHA
jgi:hypothetical protein